MAAELPVLLVRDAAAWRAWLGEHHADPDGVRLVLAKKGTVEPTSLTAVLYRIGGAKRADTRARRIKQFVDMLGRGETLYPQKRTLGD